MPDAGDIVASEKRYFNAAAKVDSVDPDLHVQLERLAQQMADRQEPGDDCALDEIVRLCVDVVPGSEYACVTLVEDDETIDTVSSTHRSPAHLDEIAHRYRQGPCLDGARDGRNVVISGDLASDERWPEFRRAVLTETSIRSLLSLTMFTTADMYGTLNIYAERPNVFGTESLAVAMACAASAADECARRMDRSVQLGFFSALVSQEVVELARGRLMERHHIDADAASRMLWRAS